MNIKVIILGIRDDSKMKIEGNFLTLNGEPSKIYLSNFVDNLGNNVESLIENLTIKYQSDISKGNYSRNNGELGAYNDDEVKFLKSYLHS